VRLIQKAESAGLYEETVLMGNRTMLAGPTGSKRGGRAPAQAKGRKRGSAYRWGQAAKGESLERKYT